MGCGLSLDEMKKKMNDAKDLANHADETVKAIKGDKKKDKEKKDDKKGKAKKGGDDGKKGEKKGKKK